MNPALIFALILEGLKYVKEKQGGSLTPEQTNGLRIESQGLAEQADAAADEALGETPK